MTAQTITLSGRVEGTTPAALVPQVAAATTTHGLKVAAPVPGALMLTRTFRPTFIKLVLAGLIAFTFVAGSLGAGPLPLS